MKKFAATGLVILFAFFFLLSCSKSIAPKAGSAKAEDMLSLLPKEVNGVIVVDAKRIMKTDMVEKAIKENKDPQKYQHFIQETGIDPQKDLYFFVAAMSGLTGGEKAQEGVAIVNLKYNKDQLLAMVKKERGELIEADYNGIKIYQAAQTDEKKPISGAFLDDSNIIVGTDAAVKKVIDVSQKKAENIWKNEQLSALMKGTNKAAMVWGAFEVPAEALKQAASQNPMLGIFADIKSILLSFDYKDNSLLAEIKAMSPDEKKNKDMADALNGFKALGAGAASKEPQVGEILNRIEITSASDYVKITANIPEDIIKSLSEKMKGQKAQTENKN
jgi:hypothetical protein